MENNESLLVVAQNDIQQFLAENKELLYNERDFQARLALFLLGTGNYQDVDLEYYVPQAVFEGKYIWKNELKIDIVVSKDGVFCPIELKYKTKAVNNEPEMIRFGTNLSTFKINKHDSQILKNQSAQDLGMYDFWKDVRRVELLKQTFPNVKGGLAVFMTNDRQYLSPTKSSSNNYHMSMCNGNHDTNRHWLDIESTCAKTHEGFDLDKSYQLNWKTVLVQGIGFHFVIATI